MPGTAMEAFPGTHSSLLAHGSSLGCCFEKQICDKVQPKGASEALEAGGVSASWGEPFPWLRCQWAHTACAQ